MNKIEELENRIGILERRLNVAILAFNEVLREFEEAKHNHECENKIQNTVGCENKVCIKNVVVTEE